MLGDANSHVVIGGTSNWIQIPAGTSPPTSAAITTGCMYFNSSTNFLYIYNSAGSAWKGVALF
mgnify:CR=1 FL=1